MFKKGDIVTISQQGTRWCKIAGGDFYRGGDNPYGTEGEVIKVGDWIGVKWSNGERNNYREFDLFLVSADLENK